MFKVIASDAESYLGFDPAREADLRAVDALMRSAAPSLERWFVSGTSRDEPGMAMSLIGYGRFTYRVRASDTPIAWPVVGLALQKNNISLYCSARRDGEPFVPAYVGRLGRVLVSKTGVLNFRRASDLDAEGFSAMMADLDRLLWEGRVELRYGRLKAG